VNKNRNWIILYPVSETFALKRYVDDCDHAGLTTLMALDGIRGTASQPRLCEIY